jgi:hypothetical protein
MNALGDATAFVRTDYLTRFMRSEGIRAAPGVLDVGRCLNDEFNNGITLNTPIALAFMMVRP